MGEDATGYDYQAKSQVHFLIRVEQPGMELEQAFVVERIDLDNIRLYAVDTLKILCSVQYMVQHEDTLFACGFDCYDGVSMFHPNESCMTFV